jgi:two-component system LytT family response regulator
LFVRANRSQLVNTTFIESVQPWFSGSLKITLKGGATVEFSRRQAQVFRDRLSL